SAARAAVRPAPSHSAPAARRAAITRTTATGLVRCEGGVNELARNGGALVTAGAAICGASGVAAGALAASGAEGATTPTAGGTTGPNGGGAVPISASGAAVAVPLPSGTAEAVVVRELASGAARTTRSV